MKKATWFFVLLSLVIGMSCGKDDDTQAGGDDTPVNLVITAKVSATGNGVVDFEAKATNATQYAYTFGDGSSGNSATGLISHTYTKAGTNTYPVTVTASSASGKTTAKTVQVEVSVTSTMPGLVWSDEFDVSGAPNAANWTFDIGTGSGGWGNNELQYYTNRSVNASVQSGMLKITAIKENFSGSAYTSARLISRGKFDFKYGRVEARAKLPAGVGTWPAIWMLGADFGTVGWPACGEIDIMEHRGSELNKIFAALHYPGRSGGNPVVNSISITNATTEFHVYKLEWTAETIKIFVDDLLFFNVPNNQSIPFNKNFFFLLNIAMGGTFGGPVDPAFTNASMEIDYIRVFRN
jgi:beta-glucanase (GH16 family)